MFAAVLAGTKFDNISSIADESVSSMLCITGFHNSNVTSFKCEKKSGSMTVAHTSFFQIRTKTGSPKSPRVFNANVYCVLDQKRNTNWI